MAKLRNVQFYRNSDEHINYMSSYDAGRSAAITNFNQQAANLQDGEILLYRFMMMDDDSGNTVYHTIVCVVHNDGYDQQVEILSNYDEPYDCGTYSLVAPYTLTITTNHDGLITVKDVDAEITYGPYDLSSETIPVLTFEPGHDIKVTVSTNEHFTTPIHWECSNGVDAANSNNNFLIGEISANTTLNITLTPVS